MSRPFDVSPRMRGRLVATLVAFLILLAFIGGINSNAATLATAAAATAAPNSGTSLTLPTAAEWSDLHGVNDGTNCPSCGAYHPNATISFPIIAADGFNYIRFAWSWNQYEQYGAANYVAYLQYVAWTAEHDGLYIEFNMQDYDTGPQYGGVGFPAYVTAGYATQYSFWTAWYANEVVVNGTDGWDAYLAVWQNVISHVDNYTSVVGYEPMNEPAIYNATSSICSSYTLPAYCTNEWYQLGSLQTYLASHMRAMTAKWILFARPYIPDSCVTGTSEFACSSSGLPSAVQIVDAAPNITLATDKGWGTIDNVVFAPHRYTVPYPGYLSRFTQAQSELEKIYGSVEPLVPVTIGEWAVVGYADTTWNSDETNSVNWQIDNMSAAGFAWTYEGWAVGSVLPQCGITVTGQSCYEYLLNSADTTFDTSDSVCASYHDFAGNCPTDVVQWELDTYLTQVIDQIYGGTSSTTVTHSTTTSTSSSTTNPTTTTSTKTTNSATTTSSASATTSTTSASRTTTTSSHSSTTTSSTTTTTSSTTNPTSTSTTTTQTSSSATRAATTSASTTTTTTTTSTTSTTSASRTTTTSSHSSTTTSSTTTTTSDSTATAAKTTTTSSATTSSASTATSTVDPASGFELVPSSRTGVLTQGGSLSFTVGVASQGASDPPVSLAVTSAPEGIKVTINGEARDLNPVSSSQNYSVSVTVSASSVVEPGTYPVTISGSAEGIQHSITFLILVTAVDDTLHIEDYPSSGGVTSLLPGTYSVGEGSNITISEMPNEGWTLEYWLVNGAQAGNATSLFVRVTGSTNVTAVFEQSADTAQVTQISYPVTISASGLPTSAVMVDGVQYQTPVNFEWVAGSTHNVTALQTVPLTNESEGQFLGWTGSTASARNSLTITTQGPSTLEASYAVRYAVSFSFTDQAGHAVVPGDILLAGSNEQIAVPSSEFAWLSNGTYYVISAVWDGSEVVQAGSYPQFTVAGPASPVLSLPIYDITVTVLDVFGDPLSGAVLTLTLPNGTSITDTTNSTGKASFPQVPEGSIQLASQYLGVASSFTINPSQDGPLTITVALSYPVYALIGLAAGTIALVMFKAKRKTARF